MPTPTATVATTVEVNGDGFVFGPDSMGTVTIQNSQGTISVYPLSPTGSDEQSCYVSPPVDQSTFLFIDPPAANSLYELRIAGGVSGNNGGQGTLDLGVLISSVNPSLIPVGTYNIDRADLTQLVGTGAFVYVLPASVSYGYYSYGFQGTAPPILLGLGWY